MRKSYLHQGIALFFLVFTFADLVNPHFCSEEMGGLPLPTGKAVGYQTATAENAIPTIAVGEARQEPSPEPEPIHEDCFCCCSHILPGLRFNLSGLDLGAPASEPANSLLPMSPPQTLFHPPRLS